ncbi:hypothetical protein AVEN_106347-1 [Araneus ventricosus]|uniref:Uncharacterized protein n=1 Tax=Araneus ventricosus TaxID=182803 RepID=A0A4Y2ASN0_ARAVE|nr:hypothetical protein AVEN_106347-1 [Araneus ventricosus]
MIYKNQNRHFLEVKNAVGVEGWTAFESSLEDVLHDLKRVGIIHSTETGYSNPLYKLSATSKALFLRPVVCGSLSEENLNSRRGNVKNVAAGMFWGWPDFSSGIYL